MRRIRAHDEALERAPALEPELPDAGSLHLFTGCSWQELATRRQRSNKHLRQP